jgi:hypothetical protein
MLPPHEGRGAASEGHAAPVVLHGSPPRRDHRDERAPSSLLRLAPIPVTPTKPLTPSHIKGLLWLDVLERATQLVRPVHYEVNRTTYDITWQTLEFWDWLGVSEVPCAEDEVSLGHRYVDYHCQRGEQPRVGAELLRARVENGYIHPASQRILEIWKRHYARLGLRDPGLTRATPLPLSQGGALEVLASAELLLDLRALGGGVYLDLTERGIAQRTLLDRDGRDNHLLCTIRQFAGLAAAGETIALLCDRELRHDTSLIEHCLRRLGGEVLSLSLGRVPLPEMSGSARHGGWERYTFDRLFEACGGCAAEEFRLGLRLYFIVGLGAGDAVPFSFELLVRFLKKARQLLAEPASGSRDAGLEQLRRLVRHRGFVDPYRLASLLLSPGPSRDLLPLLPEIFL